MSQGKMILLSAVVGSDGSYKILGEIKKRNPKGKNFFMGDRNMFTTIPTKYDLSKLDALLLMYLVGSMEYDNNVFVSTAYLAEEFKTSQTYINRSLRYLEEKGLIMRGKLKGIPIIHIEEFVALRTRKGDKEEGEV